MKEERSSLDNNIIVTGCDSNIGDTKNTTTSSSNVDIFYLNRHKATTLNSLSEATAAAATRAILVDFPSKQLFVDGLSYLDGFSSNLITGQKYAEIVSDLSQRIGTQPPPMNKKQCFNLRQR